MAKARDRLIDTVRIAGIVPRLNNDEMYALFDLAAEVTGTIVEIGCAYGGSAVAMAMASTAHLILIDNFIFNKFGQTSKRLLQGNLKKAGIERTRYEIRKVDSMTLDPIKCDMAHIDGNHTFAYVAHDLETVSGAPVIVCHDYYNVHQPGVKQAVNVFLQTHAYRLDYTVSRMAVLKHE